MTENTPADEDAQPDDPSSDDSGSGSDAGSGSGSDEKAPTPGERTGLTPGMKYTLWGVGALVVVGIVVSIVLLSTGGLGGGTPASAIPTRGPLPGATATTGSEVQSPAPSAAAPVQPAPTATAPAAPLVPGPFPESATAEGELVAGFPASVMGPVEGSTVVSSAIASEDTTMQVTLVASTSASAADVAAHYRTLWGGLGLTDGGPGTGENDLAFADQFTQLSLAFAPAGGTDTGTVYTIYGVFHTS